MSISNNFNLNEILAMCEAFGVSVQNGTGHTTLNGQDFDVKAVFENTIPLAISPILIPSVEIFAGNCQIDGTTDSFSSRCFSDESSALLAA